MDWRSIVGDFIQRAFSELDEALDRLAEAGAREEREAACAYLRRKSTDYPGHVPFEWKEALEDAADEIEQGLHVKAGR